MAVISHGLKIFERILAGFCKKTVKDPLKIQHTILNFSIDVLFIDLSSIQDQAELSSSIRLQMAKKKKTYSKVINFLWKSLIFQEIRFYHGIRF